LARINAVIFDLDNVLFDEQDYINAAYRNIARFLSERYRLWEKQIYTKLINDLHKKTSMYSHLFNDLLADLGLGSEMLPEILKIYANTTVKLELYPEVEPLFKALKRQKIKLGLVTNGNVEVQRNKVRLLGIEKYFDTIVYARELGRNNEKPNPAAFLATLKRLAVKPERVLCIGDNPHTDFFGAKKLGMRTVRILSGEFKDVTLNDDYEADETVPSLKELDNIVEYCC
jgi:putative hydrolase of the HAD superfamily